MATRPTDDDEPFAFEVTRSNRSVTSAVGFEVKRVAAIAIGNAKMKPGVARCMSKIWYGPPDSDPQIVEIAVPEIMAVMAPQKLKRRQ